MILPRDFPIDFSHPVAMFTLPYASAYDTLFVGRRRFSVAWAYKFSQVLYQMRREYEEMAKQAKRPVATSRNSENLRWANITLSEEDWKRFDNWQRDGDIVMGCVSDLVFAGHHLTVKPDDRSGGFQAFAIGKTNDCPNRNIGLSAFASSVPDAIAILCFKFYDMAAGSLAEYCSADSGNRPSRG